MGKIADYGCIVCHNEKGCHSPAEIHHVYGATTIKGHESVLPLCFLHHNSKVDCHEYTSIHPYKKRFEAKYGTQEELLAQIRERVGYAEDFE